MENQNENKKENITEKLLELNLDGNYAEIIQTTNHRSRKLGEHQSKGNK